MSQIKYRHGRKFPPRITREELYSRTNKKVEECGVNNHFQSVFTDKIAKEVVGLKEYKYESLQPELKLRDDISWKNAFTIVQHYLNDFQMKITLNTISTEIQNHKLPTNEVILKNTNSVSYLGKLIDDSSNLPPFKDCVDLFAKTENLPDSSSNKSLSGQTFSQKFTPKEQEKLFGLNNKKSAESVKPAVPSSSEIQQNNDDKSTNIDNDFEDMQIDADEIINDPTTKPPATPDISTSHKQVEDNFNNDFEESFNDESNTQNGKTITSAAFSKLDFLINVNELQSDDGKQEAEKKQLLQNLMNEQEHKTELKQPEQIVAQAQNQIQEIVENNSDIEIEIPLDSNSSDDLSTNQNQQQSQNSITNDEFVDFESGSDVNIQNDNSPLKQPQTSSLENIQNPVVDNVEENVEEFDDDDFDDFEQDTEKEKKPEQESPKTQPKTSTPKPDINNDFDDDLDNLPSADDVDLDNLPSANNSPSKSPNVQKNDDLVHVSDNSFDNDFDDINDFENDEDNSPKKHSTNTSEVQKSNQTPTKPDDEFEENLDDDFEVVVDDLDNEDVKDYGSENIDVDIDDVNDEKNQPTPKKGNADDGNEKNSQSDDMVDFDSADFDIDEN